MLAGAFAAPAAEPTCFEAGLTPASLDRVVAGAVRLLAETGHDPADYRLELRREGPWADRELLEARPLPSVVFSPRREGRAYPLRVHPAYPCVTSWVWTPARFTPWQREAVERARRLLGAGPATRLRVLESRELLRIEAERDESGAAAQPPLRAVTLRKNDLAVVDDPR